jgi:LPXTG-site transpeptidase (sortase) family protein
MKKTTNLLFVCVTLALLAWCFTFIQPASSHDGALAVTNTPAVFTPTSLPTEVLTATPVPPQPSRTPLPSVTPLPSFTPTATSTFAPTASATPTLRATQTPHALPPMGIGGQKPDAFDHSGLDLRIRIPDLNLDSLVVKVPYTNGTWDISNLGVWAGWLDTTSRPELGGNTVLVGHLDMKGGAAGPFYQIEKLQPGAEIIVNSGQAAFHYRVTQKLVKELSDVSAVQESTRPLLTLVTCYQPSWNTAERIYTQRLIVVAELASITEQ